MKVHCRRKKIRIEKIQNPSHLNVTFSKRRQGLLKKDRELSVLCGGQSATIIFSPNDPKTVYSMGHPSVNLIVDKFLGLNIDDDNLDLLNVPHENTSIDQELADVEKMIEEEEKRGKMLDAMKASRVRFEELNSDQLGELVEKFKGIMQEVEMKAEQLKERNIQFPYTTLGDALAPR